MPRGARGSRDDRDLLRLRRELPILSRGTYLVSHSMGAMPRAAAASLAEYAREWGELGLEGYGAWMRRYHRTADLVGSLFGAPRGTVVFHQNVSTLMGIVASAIWQPGSPRRKVVATTMNFPSVLYGWARHQGVGLELKLVDSPDGIVIPTERMVEAIDEQTLAVVVDHGIYRSGYLQDVPAIAAAARARGAACIVDAYQTVGCVPIDVKAWGVDFLLGGSHKWLCGGPGAAYLYARKDLIPGLRPRITGWFAHADPFAFEPELRDAPDAMRFATGTPSLPAIHAARAGIEMVAKVGVRRVRERNVRLMERFIEAASAEGLAIRSPRDPRQRSGVVCVDFPGAEGAEAALRRRGFHVDYRPQCGVRASAHCYTTEDEILSLVPELVRLRRRSGRGGATRAPAIAPGR